MGNKILLMGSCRLYKPFIKFGKDIDYSINPLGFCTSPVEVLQGLNMINRSINLKFSDFNEFEKEFFLKCGTRSFFGMPFFVKNLQFNHSTNNESLSSFDTVVIEVSSYKYVIETTKSNQVFYSYLPAIGSDKGFKYQKLSDLNFINIMNDIHKILPEKKIVINLMHNIHEIPRREHLRRLLMSWAASHDNVVIFDNMNVVSKVYIEKNRKKELDIFPGKEIRSRQYIRHTDFFYKKMISLLTDVIK